MLRINLRIIRRHFKASIVWDVCAERKEEGNERLSPKDSNIFRLRREGGARETSVCVREGATDQSVLLSDRSKTDRLDYQIWQNVASLTRASSSEMVGKKTCGQN